MITITESEHQELVRAMDRVIARHVEARGEVLADLAIIRLDLGKMTEATQRGRPLLLADFRNAVNALGHIDLDQMQAIGFFVAATITANHPSDTPHATTMTAVIATEAQARWKAFRADPITWLMQRDDETQQKVWALVEAQLR